MLFARRDIEAAGAGAAGQDESPAAKRGKPEAASGARPTLTRSEIVVAAAVLALFVAGIFCIFLAAPHREFGQILRLPRSLADVRLLKLILWWLIAIPTIREYNSYLQDSKPVKKVGAFCWLSLAICIVELLICMKFGHGLFHDPMPTWLIIFWSSAGIVLVIFLLAWSWRNHQKFRRKRL